MRVDVMHPMRIPTCGACREYRTITHPSFLIFRRRELRNRESRNAGSVDRIHVLCESNRDPVHHDKSTGRSREVRVVLSNWAQWVLLPRTQ